jgi:hypothetical protein
MPNISVGRIAGKLNAALLFNAEKSSEVQHDSQYDKQDASIANDRVLQASWLRFELDVQEGPNRRKIQEFCTHLRKSHAFPFDGQR